MNRNHSPGNSLGLAPDGLHLTDMIDVGFALQHSLSTAPDVGHPVHMERSA